MNTAQIDRLLTHHHRTRRYYLETYAADRIPDVERAKSLALCAFIVNTDVSSRPGEHWVALYIRTKNVAEYFDSLAMEPPPSPHISEFLEQFTTIIRNPTSLQSPLTSVCGQFCIYFIIKRCSGILFFDILSALRAQKNADNFVRNFVQMLS